MLSNQTQRRMVMEKPHALYAIGLLTVALVGGTLIMGRSRKIVAAVSAPPSIKNIVLVHGAFADGSGWMAVANILRRDGFSVSVAQPPETSFEDDVAATNRAIDSMGGPVALVGH